MGYIELKHGNTKLKAASSIFDRAKVGRRVLIKHDHSHHLETVGLFQTFSVLQLTLLNTEHSGTQTVSSNLVDLPLIHFNNYCPKLL